jgi:hypothetical protein
MTWPAVAAHRFAKSYALRCVRGMENATFVMRGLDPRIHPFS